MSGCSDLSLMSVGGMRPFLFARFTLYSMNLFIELVSPLAATKARILSTASFSSKFFTFTR